MGLADYIKKKLPTWPNWINIILLNCNFLKSNIYGFSFGKVREKVNSLDEEKALLDVVNFAIKNVEYYRKRYASVEIKTIEDFKSKIGFIDKDEVMAHWDEFIADNIDWTKNNVGTTGGTSGKSLKLVTPTNRYLREAVFIEKCWGEYGWFQRKAVIRNHKLENNKKFMVNPMTREFIFDAFNIDESYAREICKVMKRYKISCLYAYPSAVYQFLKLCIKQNIDLSFIKSCILSSEGITDEQYFFINKELKIPVLTIYGHSEKLIFGGNKPKNLDILIEPKYGFFELIDKDGKKVNTAGDVGEMVGSTYFNYSMPLIRYKTGDYAEYGGILKDDDGLEKVVLSKIYGRRDKSLIYKSDGTTTSLTALNLHGEVYNHIDGLQYIQEKKGYLKLLVIKNKLYTENDEKYLMEHVAYAMGGLEYVSIEYVDKLIFQSNGKFLPLISLV
jgi:phenylacetate-CoA ligase